MVEQAVDAERGIIAHRLVEHCLEILLAVVAQAQLRARLLLVAGLAGDDRDRTGGGVAAEQRALWTLEHLDALDVGEWQQHAAAAAGVDAVRSEEHTSELQSLMRISYAVFCLKKKKKDQMKTKNEVQSA